MTSTPAPPPAAPDAPPPLPPRLGYSVVVPAYDEVDSVGELLAEVIAQAAVLDDSFEVIIVDDGSTDGTRERLAELAAAEPRLVVVRLARNFGKSAAYSAGFDVARGQRVITLDADGQDDPAELPKLLALLDEADLVVGWKQGRAGNELLKLIPSAVFNALKWCAFGLGLRDSNSGYRVMRAAVAKSLRLYGDTYRFIPEMAYQRGFRVREVGVTHRPRKHGKSKYGASRFLTGLLDLLSVRFITAFTHKPLHFFGTLGLLPMLAGGGLELYALYCKFVLGELFKLHMPAILIGVMLIIVGVQLIAIGLIGEMLAAQRPGYREFIVEGDEPAAGGDSRA